MGKYKVISKPATSQFGCEQLIQRTRYYAGDLPNGSQWYIKLEMVQGKHDKFYIVGEDKDGLYIHYGRNGTAGRRIEGTSKGVAYKLFEKLSKGYEMTTDVPTWEKPFPVVFNGVDVSSLMVGGYHEIDLTPISPMFKMIKGLVYENNTFRALNARGNYVMAVPVGVVADYLKGGA